MCIANNYMSLKASHHYRAPRRVYWGVGAACIIVVIAGTYLLLWLPSDGSDRSQVAIALIIGLFLITCIVGYALLYPRRITIGPQGLIIRSALGIHKLDWSVIESISVRSPEVRPRADRKESCVIFIRHQGHTTTLHDWIYEGSPRNFRAVLEMYARNSGVDWHDERNMLQTKDPKAVVYNPLEPIYPSDALKCFGITLVCFACLVSAMYVALNPDPDLSVHVRIIAAFTTLLCGPATGVSALRTVTLVVLLMLRRKPGPRDADKKAADQRGQSGEES